MPFLRKFIELQLRMFKHNAGLTKPHPYQSTPISWPFMIRGISYWSKSSTREQIYMTGNIFGWWLSVGAVAVYAGVALADTLARRRGIEPIDERKWNKTRSWMTLMFSIYSITTSFLCIRWILLTTLAIPLLAILRHGSITLFTSLSTSCNMQLSFARRCFPIHVH